jgi:predicted DCC family thiol-disulfide oxidoreductase YuxK
MADRETPGRQPGKQDRTLIYDGHCRLCVTAKQGIEKAAEGDRLAHIRFIPYQSDEAAQQLGKDYVPGRPEVAFLIESDGSIRKGLDAFLPLLPGLKGGAWLNRLAKLAWVKPMAYLLYRLVARYRYRLFGSVR